jgi:hypothetical protein
VAELEDVKLQLQQHEHIAVAAGEEQQRLQLLLAQATARVDAAEEQVHTPCQWRAGRQQSSDSFAGAAVAAGEDGDGASAGA